MWTTERVMSMASRTIGVRAEEVTAWGYSYTAAVNAIAKLSNRNLLFRARISHRNVRYFAHKAMCDAFMETVRLAEVERQREAARMSLPSLKAPWPADAPMVITDKTVFTQCPRFEPRFQEHVTPFVHGGLRCA